MEFRENCLAAFALGEISENELDDFDDDLTYPSYKENFNILNSDINF
jgi:hypothetical protein